MAAYSLTDVAFKFEKHGFETLIFEKKRDDKYEPKKDDDDDNSHPEEKIVV